MIYPSVWSRFRDFFTHQQTREPGSRMRLRDVSGVKSYYARLRVAECLPGVCPVRNRLATHIENTTTLIRTRRGPP